MPLGKIFTALVMGLLLVAPAHAQTMAELRTQTMQKYTDLITNNQVPQELRALYNQLSAR